MPTTQGNILEGVTDGEIDKFMKCNCTFFNQKTQFDIYGSPQLSLKYQIAHGKSKRLTSKAKSSRQNQKAHGKTKKLTSKAKSSRQKKKQKQKQKAHVRSAEVKPCRARLEIGWVTRAAPNIDLFSFLLYFPVSILFYCRFEFYFTV